ncbi:hypothetical protein D2Q93_15820 [Alicyclobacillaceae bacterium I2511]|nr:hypothetical protein D2Q93_15820 [Alicyclobacillaceae bacterium I2511]
MSTTFSPDEIIQANQFRLLSQKTLHQELIKHEKLGVFFPNKGLEAVMMSYERYKVMAERLAELEEEVENLDLIQKFGDRFNAPKEEWVEHPEGMSTLEIYRERSKKWTVE